MRLLLAATLLLGVTLMSYAGTFEDLGVPVRSQN